MEEYKEMIKRNPVSFFSSAIILIITRSKNLQMSQNLQFISLLNCLLESGESGGHFCWVRPSRLPVR